MANPLFEPFQLPEPGARFAVRPKYQAEDTPYRIVPLEAPADSHSETFQDYWRLALRHKGTLALVSFLGVLAGLIATVPQTPIYQSAMALEVQNVNENFLNMRDLSPTALGSNFYSSENDVQTQIRMLESRALLRRVVANHEDLAKRLLASHRTGRWFL